MLNLLRFRDGGRESYQRYVEECKPLVEKRGGRILYRAQGRITLIGPDSWDEVKLVMYPSRAAFIDMISYTNEREQSGRKIIDFQGNQFLIADLASELAMVETWIDYVAALISAGEADYGQEASIAKMRASDLAMRMTTEAVQMHGGYGYIAEYRVERLMRDAKITQIWEGTNQVHRQLIGRSFRTK